MAVKRLDLAGRRGEAEALGPGGRFAFQDRGDRDDSGALVTSAINRSLLAGAGGSGGRPVALAGILVTEARRGRRRALAIVFREEIDVIGCDGGPGSDEEDEPVDSDDELAEPSEVLTAEERAFLNLTKRNTDFNSINSNLLGTSRTLADWVDENDQTTERSALTGRHKKFTPVVSVAPFSTGRGPGPLKINPVAPMQNGEVVPTGRIQEMVEKRSAADRAVKRDQQVTRLDEKVTRLDDKVEKITRLDDKDEKVTRLDDKILKPDEKITKLDEKLPEDKPVQKDEKPKSSEKDVSDAPAVVLKKSDPAPVSAKSVSAVRPADVKPPSPTGSRPLSEGTSQLKAAGLGSRFTDSGNAEPAKLAHRRPPADRSGSAAAVESGGADTAPADPPLSNIDLIKARLAEKAAHNGPASWRSPGNHPERNRARLNSLDGVPKSPKSPKSRSHRVSGESSAGGAAATAESPTRAAESTSSAESRTAACDRVTEPAAPEPASGDGSKNGPTAERQHLSDRDRSASTPGAGAGAETPAAAGDEEKLTGAGVKPAPADHKPPIVGDKPKLAAKPAKVKPPGHPPGWDGAHRRPSREVGVAQPTPASPKATSDRVKTDAADEPKSTADADKERLSVHLSERPSEPDKPHSRLAAKGHSEAVMSHDKPPDDSNRKSSYSPQMPTHKPTETKSNVVETKQQRAMKREQELEKRREELEKKNRVEKKTSIPSEPVRSERRPSLTPPHPEPSSPRRDSPPSHDVPPSQRGSNGSGLYAQIHQADRRRVSRDSGTPHRPAPQPSPPSRPEPEPASSQRSSFSTEEDEEDEEDLPPAAPLRAASVSPRSRRKRGGVSFAPGTEDTTPASVKPRSQSMPRPGALDQRLGRDEGIRGRFSGSSSGSGGSGEERRSRRDEPRSRARFSLKKFLKFGRDEKRKERDLVYGEFRAKPEIIHPIDRAGVGCVQVIGRPSEPRRREEVEHRRRRDQPTHDAATPHHSTPTAPVNAPTTPPRLPERQSHPAHPSHSSHPTQPTHHSHHPGHPAHGAHRISTGLTPEGRPKPPPPPPPTCRQSGDPMTPPTRPPPPNPHLLSRSRDGWARPPDSDYANLGVSRAGLTPKKPERGARSRERVDGSSSSSADQPQPAQADPDGLRRHQACRLSLREAPACAPPSSLADSYDAVTAANREALRQLWEQMSRSVPTPLLLLQAAPLSLRDFQVAPQSLLRLGRHVFAEAVFGGRHAVALCLTAGPMAPAPLSVTAVADFTDAVPARLLADPGDPDGAEVIGTVHVIPASRVSPLSSLLTERPPEESSRPAVLLLLLQTVQQLQLLASAGQPTVDEQLSQLVALTADWLKQPRVAAVLSSLYSPPPGKGPGESEGVGGGGLSPCLAALSVLLRLLGVPAAAQRARDGRGVSSVPDGPDVTTHELLASLLQRDDDASLCRVAAVLGCLLWAPEGLDPSEAERWLHRHRAVVLGEAVRSSQPLPLDEMLKLGFLAETEPEAVADALELINI